MLASNLILIIIIIYDSPDCKGISLTWLIWKLLQIPSEITAALEPIKDNEEAVRNYGVHLGTEMCKKIMASGIKTLHLYTLNNEKSALAILTVSTTPQYCFSFHLKY